MYGSGRYTAKKKHPLYSSPSISCSSDQDQSDQKQPVIKVHSVIHSSAALSVKALLTGTLAPLPHFLQCWDRAAVRADCLSGADFCADDDNNNHSWRRGRVLKRRSRSYSAIKTHIFRDAVGRSRAVDCGAHILLLG